MPRSDPALRLAVLITLVVTLAAGCATEEPPDQPGLLAARADLRGASYVVAGGPSTELRLLCHLTIAAVEAAGADAVDECGKVGSVDVRVSATRTDVDTGWDVPDARAREDGGPTGPPAVVRGADAARDVTRLEPTVFTGAPVVVTRSGPGAPAGVGELAARSRQGPTTVCAATDGPDATALAAYGLEVGTAVVVPDVNAVLADVATGRCTAGVVPGSSGRIPALGLVVLPDERGVLTTGQWTGYAPLLRTPTLTAHPGAAGVLGEVTRRLDGPAMRGMIREVEVDGRDSRDAARRWLIACGLLPRP